MAVDSMVPLWLLVAATLLAGVIAGILYERIAGAAAKRAAKFESDLVQARSELMHYREQTAQHFGKSAELLGRMASDYREFLHHFVDGAETLCGSTMKEISVSTLGRPLLDTTGAAPPPPPADPTIDSEPLAEDLPHELRGLAGSEAQPPVDRPR